jgi:hypothetical protein
LTLIGGAPPAGRAYQVQPVFLGNLLHHPRVHHRLLLFGELRTQSTAKFDC